MNESIKNYKIAIEVSTKMNSNKIRAWAYDWLSVVYQIQKNYYQAFTYMKNYEYLYDSIVTEENFKRLAAVEHKYELGKKDNEIISLGFSNKKKSLQNKIVIGAAVALLFISFLGYRNFKSKQKLQQQQIAELEKEKQLQAVDAMLKGQEEERGRLAKDLHDGLGGMLSGVKLSFSNMKENLILDADNAVRFEKSISQLDNTIAELRKVAHNLMPEALVKFGLKSAVEDFCETLQSSSGCKIMYQQLGAERDLENIANVNIYRIIQELVNNAVKHANPFHHPLHSIKLYRAIL